MKKVFWRLLIGVSLIVLFIRFGIDPILEVVGSSSKAGVKITAMPQAEVFFNEKAVGTTPFESEEFVPGEVNVKLVSGKSSWQGWVKLNKGVVSVVNRELAPSIASSSGEILTLDSGSGVVITSSPTGATLEIDGTVYGLTPFSIADLPPGEHTFLLSKEGYLKRSLKAYLPENMSLSLNVDLAITEADLSTLPTALSVSTLAEETKGIVKKTPNGFLRVRITPSTKGGEVARLSTGDTVTITEEKSGWMKVKMESGLEGYVSSTYIQKQ